MASKTNEKPEKVLTGCWQHNGVNELLPCQQRWKVRNTVTENEILWASTRINIHAFSFLLNAALNHLPVG